MDVVTWSSVCVIPPPPPLTWTWQSHVLFFVGMTACWFLVRNVRPVLSCRMDRLSFKWLREDVGIVRWTCRVDEPAFQNSRCRFMRAEILECCPAGAHEPNPKCLLPRPAGRPIPFISSPTEARAVCSLLCLSRRPVEWVLDFLGVKRPERDADHSIWRRV